MNPKLRLFLGLLALICLLLGLGTPPADAQSRKRGKKTEQRVVRKKSRNSPPAQRSVRSSRTTRKRPRNESVAATEAPKTIRRERRNERPEPAPVTVPKSESKSDRKSASSDKKVGWDDKGRPLYEESGGSRYYINASGSKVYAAAGKN